MKPSKLAASSLSLAAALLSLSLSTVARADVIGPDESACTGRAPGAACITASGGAGACTTRTLPVGNPAADASRQALLCVADGDAAAPPADGAAPSDGSVGAEPAAPSGGCRCSTIALRDARGGSVLLALGAAAALVAGRRRR